jgi:stage V sporulation protein AC
MFKMTDKDYGKFAKDRSPRSPLLKDVLLAFVVGGLICVIGQALSDIYNKLAGFGKEDARILSTISLVFIAALLTALKIYDNIAKFAGAGIIVPITGFANSIVSPAMEFKSEGLVLGLAAKMFVVAGPVLVYGITASVIYGLILLIFR